MNQIQRKHLAIKEKNRLKQKNYNAAFIRRMNLRQIKVLPANLSLSDIDNIYDCYFKIMSKMTYRTTSLYNRLIGGIKMIKLYVGKQYAMDINHKITISKKKDQYTVFHRYSSGMTMIQDMSRLSIDEPNQAEKEFCALLDRWNLNDTVEVNCDDADFIDSLRSYIKSNKLQIKIIV